MLIDSDFNNCYQQTHILQDNKTSSGPKYFTISAVTTVCVCVSLSPCMFVSLYVCLCVRVGAVAALGGPGNGASCGPRATADGRGEGSGSEPDRQTHPQAQPALQLHVPAADQVG